MASLPKRTEIHKTDELACKLVERYFNDEWLMRDLSNRDYGVDKMVEHFEGERPTGGVLLLQIKGTTKQIKVDNPKFSIKTKTLMYSELFAVPFLLIFCETVEPFHCYYIWMQEYIRIVLEKNNPKWREQETNTVYFPKDNRLDDLNSNNHLKTMCKITNYKRLFIDYVNAIVNIPYVINNYVDDSISNDVMRNNVLESLKILKRAQTPFTILTDSIKGREDIWHSVDISEFIGLGENLLKNKIINQNDYYKYVQDCYGLYEYISLFGTIYDTVHWRDLYDFDSTHMF